MIRKFEKEYRWLSNFYPCVLRFRGQRFESVEYAYMSAKSSDKAWKQLCIDAVEKPSKIKKLSQGVALVPNWDTLKLEVMRECLELKFAQEPFRSWLLETGDQYIQEGNWWGDTFWGVDLQTNKGENHLGQLIMEIRESLKAAVDSLPKKENKPDLV